MRLVLLFLILVVISCKPIAHAQSESSTLTKIVEQEVGATATIETNSVKTFALAYQNQGKVLTYIVIRMVDMKVVVKGKIHDGIVRWYNDMQIEKVVTPGIVKRDPNSDNASVKMIDLKKFVINLK